MGRLSSKARELLENSVLPPLGQIKQSRLDGTIESLLRKRNILKFTDVVLLDGASTPLSARTHLEEKIGSRIRAEFLDPGRDPSTIDRSLVEYIVRRGHLNFAPRKIKLQGDKEPFTAVDTNIREKDVHLFYRFSDPNVDSMQLFCLGDAIKRAGARSATLYLPYAPFQRQDKRDDGRVPITAKLFFDLLDKSFGRTLKRIVTADLHAKQAQAHFDGPLDEFSAIPEFAAFYKQHLGDDIKNTVVMSPDAGGAKRARYLAGLLGVEYHVYDKNRLGHGLASTRDTNTIDVRGKNVIIVDDMVDSGGSALGPIGYLQAAGAKQVYMCATHAILSEKKGVTAEERLRGSDAQFLFTDSKPPKGPNFYSGNKDWMKTISLDYALARIFLCNVLGQSVSGFYKSREKRLMNKKIDVLQATNGLYSPTN